MLTERVVRDAEATGKARTIWDAQVAGLGLQVTQGGKKNYILRYKVAGRKRQAILCRAGEVSLKEIRKRAADELLRIRAGEADPLRREREAREAPTVAEGLDRFFTETVPERLAIGKLKPKTVQEYRLQAKTIQSAIGKRRAGEVTRRDVERMVKPLRPVMRNRVLALTSRLFTLFQSWEWCDGNPVRFVEKAREEPRDRTLNTDELAALGTALDAENKTSPVAVTAIRIATMTGLRIGEVIAMKWADIDFEGKRVVLPDTKTGRRWQMLSSVVLVTLGTFPRLHGSEYVFTTAGRAHVTYKTVHGTFARAVRRAGLEDVRIHDLRRTLMTTAAGIVGVNTHVMRDLLGHRTAMMADRYIRHQGAAVAEATERMGARMKAIMEGKPKGDVVPLGARRG